MSEVTDDELTCRSLSSRTGACRLVYALSSDGLLRLGARNSAGKHLPGRNGDGYRGVISASQKPARGPVAVLATHHEIKT